MGGRFIRVRFWRLDLCRIVDLGGGSVFWTGNGIFLRRGLVGAASWLFLGWVFLFQNICPGVCFLYVLQLICT